MIQLQLSPQKSGFPFGAPSGASQQDRASAARTLGQFVPGASVVGCSGQPGSLDCGSQFDLEPFGSPLSSSASQPGLQRQLGSADVDSSESIVQETWGSVLNLDSQTVDETVGPGLSVADAQEQAPVYLAGTCDFGVYDAPWVKVGTHAAYAYADLFGCDTAAPAGANDCSETSTETCCYRDADAQCAPLSCTWGPLDRPPLYSPFLLLHETAYISVLDFTCSAHVDLVRAALFILRQAAHDDGFLDWLMCAFGLSNAVDPGTPDIAELKQLLLGGAPKALRINQDNTQKVRGMAFASGSFGAGSYLESDKLISIVTDHRLFRSMAAQWNYGTEEEKLCAALRLSAVLGHEALHIVGMKHDPHSFLTDLAEDVCNTWHIFTNTYLWSFHARMGFTSDQLLCCNFGSNTRFFSDCFPHPLLLDRKSPDLLASACLGSLVSEWPTWLPTGPSFVLPYDEDDLVCPTEIWPMGVPLP